MIAPRQKLLLFVLIFIFLALVGFSIFGVRPAKEMLPEADLPPPLSSEDVPPIPEGIDFDLVDEIEVKSWPERLSSPDLPASDPNIKWATFIHQGSGLQINYPADWIVKTEIDESVDVEWFAFNPPGYSPGFESSDALRVAIRTGDWEAHLTFLQEGQVGVIFPAIPVTINGIKAVLAHPEVDGLSLHFHRRDYILSFLGGGIVNRDLIETIVKSIRFTEIN